LPFSRQLWLRMRAVASCKGLIDDAAWASIRAYATEGYTFEAIRRFLKCSWHSVQQAVANDIRPSLRARRVPPQTVCHKAIARRRRLVRQLITKTVTCIGKKVLRARGRPRKDGVPRKTTTVTRKVLKLKYPSPQAVARALKVMEVPASRSTVRRDLAVLGFRKYRRPVLPRLSKADTEKRLKFSKASLCKSLKWFAHLAFSDEKWFDSNDHGNIFQYIRPEDKALTLLPREREQGAAKVFVWGVIAVGLRFIRFVKLRPGHGMDATDYIEQCIKPYLRLPRAKKVTLMQDGARCHWTPAVKQTLGDAGVSILEGWPAHSPDLNPIEHVWSMLQKAVSDRGPWGAEQLQEFVASEFDSITIGVIDGLVLSFWDRVTQCVARKGAAVGK